MLENPVMFDNPVQSPTPMSGLGLVPATTRTMTSEDFKTDQEARWCPGCGDYAILAAVQGLLPDLGLARENMVFISGIGCSSRLPYYLNTYGMHSIHGRAPAIATGLAMSRPDLSVWVVTGDGDALSIGGNHLIHALRRNVNLKILLFNNQIYGLTKGQYSPTSEAGKVTKSTPVGSVDRPLNPISLALGAEATFVARTIDSDREHLTGVLRAAAQHRGTALVEILQNCNIFNDGAFDPLKNPDSRGETTVRLQHGEPMVFGTTTRKGVRVSPRGGLEIVALDDVDSDSLLVHDVHQQDSSLAFMLSRLGDRPGGVTPLGVFRDVARPAYDDLVNEQIVEAGAHGRAPDLSTVIAGNDTWLVGPQHD